MSIDPIRFNLPPSKPAGTKPAAPAEPVVGPKMTEDAWQGTASRDENERYRLDPKLEEQFGDKGSQKKLKLGLGANLDESTRLELNASLKKGGTVKVELHHKF